MPQLPVFTAKIGDAPISGGRRATVPGDGVGRIGQSLIKAADAFLSDKEDKESRTALIASSEIRAKYARALDDAALSDEDTAKLKERMQEEMSKVGDEFQTTRGHQTLQLYTSQTELGFDEQANRIKITRAGAEARLEGSKFLNSASELIRSNPGYLKQAEGDAEAFVSTLKNISPLARAEIAQGLKKELNMAAAVSAARMDPESTKRKLEAGEWDLTPQQREQAVGKADTEIRAKRADEAFQRATRDYEERETDDKARDKHFADIMGGSATRRSIMDDADLRPQTREHLIVFMEERAKERTTREKKSNPTVMRDLWIRIHAPEDDPRRVFNGDPIFQAVQRGQLNTTDANQLNVLVANQKDENNRTFGTRLQGRMQTVAGAMRAAPLYQNQPELAAAIQLEMVAQVEKRAAALRRDNKDPGVLLDPDHKDYYFTPGLIKSVADDVQQRARDAMPPMPDLRAEPDAWKEIEVGALFIDPHGRTNKMTPELKDALSRAALELPSTPAGQTVTGTIRVQ
jgi:hypothetical protein